MKAIPQGLPALLGGFILEVPQQDLSRSKFIMRCRFIKGRPLRKRQEDFTCRRF